MKIKLLEMLACPKCHADLELKDAKQNNFGEIEDGLLICKQNGCIYPIKESIPRFVDSDKYVSSFSLQRKHTKKHFEDYEKDKRGYKRFTPTTGFHENDINSGITLEVGCGYGRFLDVVNNMGGEIVGMDLSTDSINLAHQFVGAREKVYLVQGDASAPPFKMGYFDKVFSIGVLHHTPDTRSTFEAIVPLVKKSGTMVIWVYSPELVASENRWRIVTSRLPHKMLLAWCIFNESTFYWIRRIPFIGWRFHKIIPGCLKWDFTFWMRVISNIDALSPKYAHTHTPEEVIEWFEKCGFKEIEALPRRTSVKGIKI